MTVEQKQVIDMMGTREGVDTYTLGISDHLDWENTEKHLRTLQDKINAYLAFMESNELTEKAPESKGKRIVICVYAKYPLPEKAQVMYSHARKTLREAGFDLEFILSKEGE